MKIFLIVKDKFATKDKKMLCVECEKDLSGDFPPVASVVGGWHTAVS